tara:strand:- start:1670 stop:1930 length:261 start_codon:yes stop_codon:yes gene_type:complete
VPDLNVELEELHASVVRAVRDRLDNGEQTNDDIRTALQLLKQNSITAQIDKDTSEQLKTQMAKKLDFSALQGKVVPLKGSDQERHA